MQSLALGLGTISGVIVLLTVVLWIFQSCYAKINDFYYGRIKAMREEKEKANIIKKNASLMKYEQEKNDASMQCPSLVMPQYVTVASK